MWLPKEGKFILLFSNKISKSGISAWATTRGRPYEIIFMQSNNNLPVCFLLGHPGKPIPEPYLGIGVATRQTIIYRHKSDHGNPHQGGWVRRSRTFSVPKARKIQNRRFCQPPSDRRMRLSPKQTGLPPLIIC